MRRTRLPHGRAAAACLVLALAIASCSQDNADQQPAQSDARSTVASPVDTAAPSPTGSLGTATPGSFGNSGSTMGVMGAAATAASGPAPSTMMIASRSGAIGPTVGAAGSAAAEADAGVDGPAPLQVPPGQLTAGEWNDLDHWEFWRQLQGACPTGQTCSGAGQAHSEHWGYASLGRIPVVVTSGSTPVVDAKVTLTDADQKTVWEAHTDHRGHAELFAGMFGSAKGPFQVVVEAGGDSAQADGVNPGDAQGVALSLPAPHMPAPSLDLMFLVDTTGSMGDELRYIKAELDQVIGRVRDQIGAQLALRVSVNFYRDVVDPYVVRPFPFTTDVSEAVAEVSAQDAAGGGDFPEAVEQGLKSAIEDHDWSPQASARILFMVLDAPPHDDADKIATMHDMTQAAAAKGVEIIPVAASGVDKSTEFLLRNLAVATNGTYTFLTDDSGIGDPHLVPTTGHFDVELLDELLARLISERL